MKALKIRRWEKLARGRVHNILKKHLVASRSQLEAKISEAGPKNMRAEPLFISKAIKTLKQKGKLKKVSNKYDQVPLYALTSIYDVNKKEHRNRYEKVKNLNDKFQKIRQGKNGYDIKGCGEILEIVTYKSAKECTNFAINGSPGDPPNHINGYNVEDIGRPEFIFIFPTSKDNYINVFIECKNIRNWLYPDNYKIWTLLYRAAQMEMVPVMIARKFAYPTRFLFQKLGVLGFETHFQYFAPHLKDDMKEIVHKNGLGFHATRFSNEKEVRFTKFFDTTLNRQIETLNDTFLSLKDEILPFAEKLSDNSLSHLKRKKLYKEAFVTFIRPEWGEQKQKDYFGFLYEEH